MASSNCCERSAAEADANEYIRVIATRHGFRLTDLLLSWDRNKNESPRRVCTVVIATADGASSVKVDIDREALLSRDRWRYLPRIEAALSELRGRSGSGQ